MATFDSSIAELLDSAEFFAPTPHDLVDGLIWRYKNRRAQIEQVAGLFQGDLAGVVGYFLEGNSKPDRGGYSSMMAERIFEREGAIAALNSDFWSQALQLTDVYECMPQARRTEWNDTIRGHKAPEFTEDNVRATLGDLLAARSQFLAERVDGIFRNLSRSHVTNTPEGFGKRMILAYAFSDWGSVNSDPAGYIEDLRRVIAKFMGRGDDSKRVGTYSDLAHCRENPGVWHSFDGGALRIRAYKKGTAHLEVHPDMAWRLNTTLAHLYPAAIPSRFREKPKTRSREFPPLGRPLPFAVIAVLRSMRTDNGKDWTRGYGESDKRVVVEALRVCEMIGGVIGDGTVQFDYDAREVIREILTSGCIPDRASHQFYPTPDALAARAVALAGIDADHQCLEPSAGLGALAAHMPSTTVCVEQSALFCAALRAKGHNVIEADFLKWAESTSDRFERIVMNPPFADGRALAHVTASAGLLSAQGRMVAILPASLRGKTLVHDREHEWTEMIANQFDHTSVSVAIVTITRK